MDESEMVVVSLLVGSIEESSVLYLLSEALILSLTEITNHGTKRVGASNAAIESGTETSKSKELVL
jgi:hypothetical protein